jgi:hypothetical protein
MLRVYSSTGQCIVNEQVAPDKEIKLDLTRYPSGIYFIIIQNDTGIRTLKYSLMR